MEITPILGRVPSPVVFDHLAHIPELEGIDHPLFAQIRALIDEGRTWVGLRRRILVDNPATLYDYPKRA